MVDEPGRAFFARRTIDVTAVVCGSEDRGGGESEGEGEGEGER